MAVIIGGTVIAIQYGKGSYRITQDGFSQSSGLLNANSFPTGAEVSVDGRLVTVTDETIYLDPGQYNVEIRKEGFSPWNKILTVQKELVTQTNAQLFPLAPSLTPFSFTGVENVSPSPDGQKLIYYTASASAQSRNGLYVLELSSGQTLPFQRSSRQISNDPQEFNLRNAQIVWSPDSSEAILMTDNRQVLLDLSRRNELETLSDVSFRSRQLFSQWEAEMYERERQFLRQFPPQIIQVATQSAKNVYFSPDKKRLLYTATASVTLAEKLIPPVPATSTQLEERNLTPGTIYVYDREEDRNFKVATEAEIAAGKIDQTGPAALPSPTPAPTKAPARKPTMVAVSPVVQNALDKLLLAADLFNSRPLSLQASPSAFTRLQASDSAQTAQLFNTYHSSLYAATFQWFPDSRHLLWVSANQIQIKEYDNTNVTKVYSGPYAGTFVYPWPDGSQLLILTSFSPETPNNLYAIELR